MHAHRAHAALDRALAATPRTACTPVRAKSTRWRAHSSPPPIRPVTWPVSAATPTSAGSAHACSRQPSVTVIVGRPSLAESADVVVDAAVELRDGVPGARFLSALRRGNVHGALDMGLAPGLLPGRVALGDGSADAARRVAECAGATRPRRPRHPRSRRRRSHHDARAARLPTRCATSPTAISPGRALETRRPADRGRSVRQRVGAPTPTSCSRRPARPRSRARSPTSKVASARWRNKSRRRAPLAPTGSSPPIWRRSSARACGSSRTSRSGTRSRGSRRRTPVSTRRPIADGVARARRARAYTPDRPLGRARGRSPLRRRRRALLLVATRTMYDQGVGLQHSPSSAHLAPSTSVRLNPADFDKLGCRQRHYRAAWPRPEVRSTHRRSPTAACPRGQQRWSSTKPTHRPPR